MENHRDFIKSWKSSMTPTDFPLTDDSLNPTPYQTPVSPSALPSSPKRRLAIRHPPRKLPPSCPACGENHGLLRCSTFQSYNVDRRNKLVRDKRLCINCFSDQHGFRSCPSRFSCRSYSGRRHTLLHRDRESSSHPLTSSTSAQNMTAAVSSSTDKTSAHNTRFLHTVSLSLKNDGIIVKARALLDSGAAVSVMTEKLVSDLNLKRTPNPIPISGTAGTMHCKFTVSTSLQSHDGSFESDPITFTVFPKLPFLQIPPNKQKILDTPVLSSYHLADPDLGGRVDLLLNIHDSH